MIRVCPGVRRRCWVTRFWGSAAGKNPELKPIIPVLHNCTFGSLRFPWLVESLLIHYYNNVLCIKWRMLEVLQCVFEVSQKSSQLSTPLLSVIAKVKQNCSIHQIAWYHWKHLHQFSLVSYFLPNFFFLYTKVIVNYFHSWPEEGDTGVTDPFRSHLDQEMKAPNAATRTRHDPSLASHLQIWPIMLIRTQNLEAGNQTPNPDVLTPLRNISMLLPA